MILRGKTVSLSAIIKRNNGWGDLDLLLGARWFSGNEEKQSLCKPQIIS